MGLKSFCGTWSHRYIYLRYLCPVRTEQFAVGCACDQQRTEVLVSVVKIVVSVADMLYIAPLLFLTMGKRAIPAKAVHETSHSKITRPKGTLST